LGYPQGFTKQDFFSWFNASYDTRIPDGPGKWDTEGTKLEFNIDPKTGVKDFEKSLQRKGAILVYIGHSTLTRAKSPKDPLGPSLGLSPKNPEKGPEIPNTTLRTLLSKSAASLVIIGSCDSQLMVHFGPIGNCLPRALCHLAAWTLGSEIIQACKTSHNTM
jgi:hypothetical protein